MFKTALKDRNTVFKTAFTVKKHSVHFNGEEQNCFNGKLKEMHYEAKLERLGPLA